MIHGQSERLNRGDVLVLSDLEERFWLFTAGKTYLVQSAR